jgi:hypothetical protein
MSSSRVERRGAASLAGLLFLALAATPALGASGEDGSKAAASGAPTSIDPMGSGGETPIMGPPVPPEAPPPEVPAASEPAPSEPMSAEPAPTEAPPAEPASREDVYTAPAPSMEMVGPRPGVNEPTVEVGTLGAPDASRVGILSAASGGLPADMWTGTSRATAVSLLRELKSATRSRAMQTLERRALLSEADAPKGGGSATSLLALRLARLLDMGDLESVLRLGTRVLVTADYEEEQRMRAEALLYDGKEDDACNLGRSMRMLGRDIYWSELGAYCEQRADNSASAQLSVQLIQQRGVDAPSFFALFDRLSGTAPADAPPPPDEGTGLSFAMRRAAGLGPADAGAYASRPAALRALALSAGGKADERLSFAEDAASFGAVSAPSLAAVYGLQSFGPAELADPRAAASSMPRAQGNALLVAAIGTADLPARRIELALAAYKRAREQGLGPAMMEILAPLLQNIAPEASLSWAAADLVQAYLAISQPERAYAWYALAVSGRERSSAEGGQRDRLANLLRIAAPSEDVAWSRSDARKLVHRAYKRGGDALGRLAFELALLSALGYEVPPDDSEQLPTLQPVPAGAVSEAVARFESAVAGRRVAEAVFNGLIALGPKGPAASQHATVVSIVHGLSALGLDADARAIACEALLDQP